MRHCEVSVSRKPECYNSSIYLDWNWILIHYLCIWNETCLHKLPMINSIITKQKAECPGENKAGGGKKKSHYSCFSCPSLCFSKFTLQNVTRLGVVRTILGLLHPKNLFCLLKRWTTWNKGTVVQPCVLHACISSGGRTQRLNTHNQRWDCDLKR